MCLSALFWNISWKQTMLSFGEIDNNVELVQLHERKEAAPGEFGDIWCKIVVNITKGSHSISALTKKVEYSHFLTTVLWCWFGHYPHSHQLLICLTSKTYQISHCSWSSCNGMHPLSALGKMASFRLCFTLPFSKSFTYLRVLYLHSAYRNMPWYVCS